MLALQDRWDELYDIVQDNVVSIELNNLLNRIEEGYFSLKKEYFKRIDRIDKPQTSRKPIEPKKKEDPILKSSVLKLEDSVLRSRKRLKVERAEKKLVIYILLVRRVNSNL